MRRRLIVVAVTMIVLVAVPLGVLAAVVGGGGGRLDHQRFKFRTGDITTTGTSLHDIPGLSGMLVCARGGLSVSVSVTAGGAPFALTVRIDNGPMMHPGVVRFAGGGADSASYNWVRSVGPFEGSDGHSFAVQWKSVTGGPVTLHKATMDLLFQDGTQC
jgi:hypothetical protein